MEGLHELTELQREVLFRTVINGESVSSVANDKNCSDRNIRDIRIRALDHLRKKTNVDTRGNLPWNTILPIIGLLCLMGIIVYLLSPCLHYLEQISKRLVISVVAIALPVLDVYLSRRAAEEMIRHWWDHLNTPKQKK